jgi:hypothetical protein
VVLSHTPECREVGARKVKSGNSTPGVVHGSGNDVAYRFGQKESGPHYAGADGLETVTAWDCHPECPVRMLDEQSGERTSGSATNNRKAGGSLFGNDGQHSGIYADRGGASRFFLNVPVDSGDECRFAYHPKASRAEREKGLEGMPQTQRNGEDYRRKVNTSKQSDDGIRGDVPRTNDHPTVKPLALMRWLCRLVTPPNGKILDPFMGSGTTGCAAVLEGFRFIGIDREAEYVAIAEKRIAHWAATVQPSLLPAA